MASEREIAMMREVLHHGDTVYQLKDGQIVPHKVDRVGLNGVLTDSVLLPFATYLLDWTLTKIAAKERMMKK